MKVRRRRREGAAAAAGCCCCCCLVGKEEEEEEEQGREIELVCDWVLLLAAALGVQMSRRRDAGDTLGFVIFAV